MDLLKTKYWAFMFVVFPKFSVDANWSVGMERVDTVAVLRYLKEDYLQCIPVHLFGENMLYYSILLSFCLRVSMYIFMTSKEGSIG
jgi:hypothetical protein